VTGSWARPSLARMPAKFSPKSPLRWSTIWACVKSSRPFILIPHWRKRTNMPPDNLASRASLWHYWNGRNAGSGGSAV